MSPVEVKTRSLPDAVYEALRESIVMLEDASGTVLTEMAVGVATVVRVACVRLIGWATQQRISAIPDSR